MVYHSSWPVDTESCVSGSKAAGLFQFIGRLTSPLATMTSTLEYRLVCLVKRVSSSSTTDMVPLRSSERWAERVTPSEPTSRTV